MLIKNKFNGYSPDGQRLYRIFDGGGSSAPSQTLVSGSELPEWAKPYAQETLQKAQAVSSQPYSYYGGPRIAGFSPLQLQAQRAAGAMTTAPQVQQATNLAGLAGTEAFRAGQYAPGLFGSTFQAPAQYAAGQFGNAFQAPSAYTPGDFSAQQVQAPSLTQYQMAAPERVSAAQVGTPTMAAAQTGYDPRLTTFQMAGPERVGTGTFTQPGMAEQYMSPYMEQAVAPQLREARRASDIQAAQIGAEAAKQGAFGGGRSAILEAERRRNLATQTGDIRARGLQQAYEQAQQLYGTEQQRALQAALANQQAGLTAGGQNLAAALGVQQLGAQTGLQTALANLSSQQQANVQNQAAALQAQGLNAQQAMQAALANQQAGLTAGQANLQALLGTQQLGAGQSLQAQLANQQAMQQAQQLREQSRQFGAGQGLQAAGLGAQYGLAAQQLGEQSRQFGAGQGLQAASLGAQYGQAAQQLGEQSRQYGAGLGMQGLGTALSAAGQLGQLGAQQFGQQQGIVGLQSQLGAQQQALRQQGLTQAYQDFLAEQNYPFKQLGFMSDITRGLPLGQQSAQQVYTGAPSALQTIGSLGLGAYGLKQLGMFAEGGSVTDDAFVEAALDKMSDTQLAEAERAAIMRNDISRLNMIAEEKATRASERNGLAGAFNQMPAPTKDRMVAAARGGILAFRNGDSVEGDDSDEDSRRREREDLRLGAASQPEFYRAMAETAEIPTMTPEERMTAIRAAQTGLRGAYGASALEPFMQDLAKQREALSGRREEGKGLMALAAAQALSSTPNIRSAIGQALGAVGTEAAKLNKDIRDSERLLQQSQMHLAQAKQAREDRMFDTASALVDRGQTEAREAAKLKRDVNLKMADIASRERQAGLSREQQAELAKERSRATLEAARIGASRPGETAQAISSATAAFTASGLKPEEAQLKAVEMVLGRSSITDWSRARDDLLAAMLAKDATLKDDPVRLAEAKASAGEKAASNLRGFGQRAAISVQELIQKDPTLKGLIEQRTIQAASNADIAKRRVADLDRQIRERTDYLNRTLTPLLGTEAGAGSGASSGILPGTAGSLGLTPAASGAGTATPSGGFPQPNAGAISALKSGLGTREQFDETFGPGAAAKVLGK